MTFTLPDTLPDTNPDICGVSEKFECIICKKKFRYPNWFKYHLAHTTAQIQIALNDI